MGEVTEDQSQTFLVKYDGPDREGEGGLRQVHLVAAAPVQSERLSFASWHDLGKRKTQFPPGNRGKLRVVTMGPRVRFLFYPEEGPPRRGRAPERGWEEHVHIFSG